MSSNKYPLGSFSRLNRWSLASWFPWILPEEESVLVRNSESVWQLFSQSSVDLHIKDLASQETCLLGDNGLICQIKPSNQFDSCSSHWKLMNWQTHKHMDGYIDICTSVSKSLVNVTLLLRNPHSQSAQHIRCLKVEGQTPDPWLQWLH